HYHPDVKAMIQTFIGGGSLLEGVTYEEGYAYNVKFNFEREIINGHIDAKPDLYNFSVGGFSGDFFIDYDTESGICINNPAVKIIPVFQNLGGSLNINKCIVGFTIIAED